MFRAAWVRPRPPHRRESAKHSKDHSPLNSRKFFRSLSLCFPTSKTRLEIHEMIETGMKYLAQSPHTLYDHLACPAHPAGGGGVTCRGLCTSARTKCRPSLSTFSNSPVQQFFTRGRSCPLRPGTTGNVWRHLGLSQPRRCGWRLVSGSRLELPLDGARGALPDSCGALVWAEPAGVTEPWLSTRITAALSDRRPGHVRSTVTLVVTCARAQAAAGPPPASQL